MPVIAIYRPVTEKTSQHIPHIARTRDRRFKGMFFHAYKILIISALYTVFFPKNTNAQTTNELCFEELCAEFIAGHPRAYKKVQGFTTPPLLTRLSPQASAPFVLEIGRPQIDFENLDGPYFARTLSVNIIYRDSTDHEYAVSRRDTFHRKSISEIRKTKVKALRGRDPRFHAKYLIPALVIGAGISGIISLFYIRSA